jgi:hypothetical protein
MPTGRSIRRRPILVVLVALIAMASVWTPSPAGAHTGDASYLYIDIVDGRIEGRIEYPVRDVNRVLGLDLPESGAAMEALGDDLDLVQAYTLDHFAMGVDGDEWTIRMEDDGVEVLDIEIPYVILPFTVEETFAEVPKRFEVELDAMIEAIDDYSVLLHIGTYWEAGIYANEAESLLVYQADKTVQTVDLGESSWWRGFRGTVDLGVDHIRIGTDHILFILTLVLPAVLVFDMARKRWEPEPTFGSALWRITKIATMFTIAHSITLTIAGLGWLDLPGKPVEALIAASIIAAALHNIRPVFANREWAIAFGFGLFHGLGFAGLLADLGLDRTNRFWSLFGFNVGVELGQLAIIIGVFPALFLLRRLPFYVRFMHIASLLMAVVAFGWAIERVFEVDLKVNSLVDPVMDYPRVLLPLAVLTAVAALLHLRARARGELLPVAGTDEPLETIGDEVPEPMPA